MRRGQLRFFTLPLQGRDKKRACASAHILGGAGTAVTLAPRLSPRRRGCGAFEEIPPPTLNQSGGCDLRSRIHQRASRNHALSKAQENANHQKSKVRARIEHVFGAQEIAPGGRIVRTIGIVRAKAKIGLQNLAYNIRRLVTLERMAAA